MRFNLLLLMGVIFLAGPTAFGEMRSASDMAKECRVALDIFQKHIDNASGEDMMFVGECIGYVQAAADASYVLTENVKWFKVCIPDSTSTLTLIQKFVAFVDKYPKYVLASTAFNLMLGDEFPCKK